MAVYILPFCDYILCKINLVRAGLFWWRGPLLQANICNWAKLQAWTLPAQLIQKVTIGGRRSLAAVMQFHSGSITKEIWTQRLKHPSWGQAGRFNNYLFREQIAFLPYTFADGVYSWRLIAHLKLKHESWLNPRA